MRPLTLLFLLFLLVPLLEIYLLIKVGSAIGAPLTVFLVVFTAVVGAILLRIQGFTTLARVRAALSQGQVPALEMLEGVVLLVGGALLLTPGFFTDGLGFLCLLAPLRRHLLIWAMERSLFGSIHGQHGHARWHDPRTIDGHYRRVDEDR